VPELDPPVHRDDLDADGQSFFRRLAGLEPAAAVELMRPDFAAYVRQLNPSDPDDTALVRRFLAELDPADAELMTAPEPMVDGRPLGSDAAIAAGIREALANQDGYLRDAAIAFRRWDFPLARITCPVHLWYGADDANASPRNGEWLAARLPAATLTVHERTTHLAVLHRHWDEILAALKSGAVGGMRR
jgi:pimeloyl-ACP methyl ester carboxylesterase